MKKGKHVIKKSILKMKGNVFFITMLKMGMSKKM